MDPEYELLDTGIFNEDRYFDVFVEYAKAAPTDLLIEISVCNRGPDESVIHVLPTLWFRNIWSWWPEEPKPSLKGRITRKPRWHDRCDRLVTGDLFSLLRRLGAPAVHRKRHQQPAAF